MTRMKSDRASEWASKRPTVGECMCVQYTNLRSGIIKRASEQASDQTAEELNVNERGKGEQKRASAHLLFSLQIHIKPPTITTTKCERSFFVFNHMISIQKYAEFNNLPTSFLLSMCSFILSPVHGIHTRSPSPPPLLLLLMLLYVCMYAVFIFIYIYLFISYIHISILHFVLFDMIQFDLKKSFSYTIDRIHMFVVKGRE